MALPSRTRPPHDHALDWLPGVGAAGESCSVWARVARPLVAPENLCGEYLERWGLRLAANCGAWRGATLAECGWTKPGIQSERKRYPAASVITPR